VKRHRIDPFSLVAGLFITGIAVAALVGPWRIEFEAWVWPTALIVAGLAVLGLVAAGQRGATTADPEVTAPGTTADPEREAALAAARAELDEHATTEVERD
jgi:hypothetical protein